MDYRVIILEQAERDLNDIYSYIYFNLKSKNSADRIAHRLRVTISGLSTMPNRFRIYPVEPWKSRGVRSVPVGNFTVFYLVNDVNTEVQIIRIVYGKRNVKKVLR